MRAVTVAMIVVPMLACDEERVVARQRVPGGIAARGERTIVSYGCGSCHVIPGIPGAVGSVGPPLTDLADRTYLAGQLRNGPTQLIEWIRFPQRIRPTGVMPDLGVTEQDARDIAAYLYTLSGNRLGPPHPVSRGVIPSH